MIGLRTRPQRRDRSRVHARQAATGFFGVIALAAFACGPVLIARKATAKLMERTAGAASSGHGIVQAVAQDVPAPRSPALEHEHSESDVRVEVEVELDAEADTPEEPPTSPKPAHAGANVKVGAPAMKPPVADASADVALLEHALTIQMQSLPICRRANGPEGPGIAEVTFIGEGRARVGLSEPYANTPVGSCVARRLAGAAMPFDGEPVTLRIRFEL